MDIKEYIQSGVIESYVLGLTDQEEGSELENLMAEYPEVMNAVNEFSDAIEQQAIENAVEPPEGIKERLMAELSFEDRLQAENDSPLVVAYSSTANETAGHSIANKTNTWKWLAAASVILFVISAASNYYLYNKYASTNSQYQALLVERNTLQANNQVFQTKVNDYQAAVKMMANPEYAMVQLKDPTGKQDNMTTVFWNTNTKDVYLMNNKLPEPDKNKKYQLWALVDGKPVDAGMIEPGCTSLCKMKNIPKAQAFAITLEAAGGSPTPHLEQLYVMGKV